MRLVLAIDIGTSSTRAALVDASLIVHSLAARTYPLHTPQPGWAEQDAEEIARAVDDAVRECVASMPQAERPRGVASTPRCTASSCWTTRRSPHSPLDVGGHAGGAASGAARRRQTLAHDLYSATGCPVHAVYHPAKIRWLKEERPELLRRAKAFATIKGYILQRLVGRRIDDLGMASTIGLLDTQNLRVASHRLWRRRVSTIPISCRTLSLRKRRRRAFGGGGPLLGHQARPGGSRRDRRSFCQHRRRVRRPGRHGDHRRHQQRRADDRRRSPAGRSRAHLVLLPGRLPPGSSAGRSTAGGAPRLGCSTRFRHQGRRSVSRPLGPDGRKRPRRPEGLIFAPYLAGERNPGWQGEARGYMAGIGLHHRAEHFVRAAMEGIAYQIAWVYESVAETAGEPARSASPAALSTPPFGRKSSPTCWDGSWRCPSTTRDRFWAPPPSALPRSTRGSIGESWPARSPSRRASPPIPGATAATGKSWPSTKSFTRRSAPALARSLA